MAEILPPRDDHHPESAESGCDRLTGIPQAYTLPSTHQNGSEADDLMIRHFLNTLAEVALAVASRNIKSQEEEHLK